MTAADYHPSISWYTLNTHHSWTQRNHQFPSRLSRAHLKSQKTCGPDMYSETNLQTEPISLGQVHLSSLHWSTNASSTSSANLLTGVGQLKCPTPKKSTAKITTNILRLHIPLMQGQWSQPRLDEWRTNQLATASRWMMDACQGHKSCSVQDDKWTFPEKPNRNLTKSEIVQLERNLLFFLFFFIMA